MNNTEKRKKKMKVLLVNGSPHKTDVLIRHWCEVSEALNEQGIDTDIF